MDSLVAWAGLVASLHLGSLHTYERWLAFILAFAPFVVLGIVIAVRRRNVGDRQD